MDDKAFNWIVIGICGVLALIGGVVLYQLTSDSTNGDQEQGIQTTDQTASQEINDAPDTIVSIENESSTDNEPSQNSAVVIFHNGTGPMCIEALDFFEEKGIVYEEHLTDEPNFSLLLTEYRDEFEGQSEGVSDNFGYYPMIFVGDSAFSGFNDEVENRLSNILGV